MNRFFNQFYWSLVKGKTVLFGKVAIGAAGAPTLSAVNSKGIASMSRTAAGKYTITLQDKYVSFLGMQITPLLASGLPANISFCVVSESVSSAKTVVIQCLDAAGAAVDPDSGQTIYFEIKLSSSTAQ